VKGNISKIILQFLLNELLYQIANLHGFKVSATILIHKNPIFSSHKGWRLRNGKNGKYLEFMLAAYTQWL
jgi:hypothetical protein